MIVVFWILFCCLVGHLAQKKGHAFGKFFLLSIVISPIGGLIVLLVVGEKNEVKAEPQHQHQPRQVELQRPTYSLSPSNPTPTSETAFCPECGTELDDDTVFCPKCGNKIQSDSTLPTELNKTKGAFIEENKTPVQQHTASTKIQKLKELKTLLDEGLISPDEFQAKKGEILNS